MPLEALHGKRATWPASTLSEISAVEQQGAVVETFLIGVRQEGPETTNCRRQDLRFVQDWIGHASIGNTVIYGQLTNRRRDEEARKVFSSQYVV